MTWVPNALSYSRAFAAAPIALLAYLGQWELAFWIFAAGVATDFLDGAAANLLRCGTKRGKEVIDPRCDAIMSGGVVLGWVLEEDHLFRFCIAIAMVPVGLLIRWQKLQQDQSPIQKRAAVVLPLCYLTTLYLFGYHYAHNAYGDQVNQIWIVASAILIPLAVFLKFNRIRDWISGRL